MIVLRNNSYLQPENKKDRTACRGWKIQVSTGKEYLFLAGNLRTVVWGWKLTVLEYNS